jgi:hypothetical protein
MEHREAKEIRMFYENQNRKLVELLGVTTTDLEKKARNLLFYSFLRRHEITDSESNPRATRILQRDRKEKIDMTVLLFHYQKIQT